MSEFETTLTCPKCGKNLTECVCEQFSDKKADRVIEIKHTGLESSDLAKQLAEERKKRQDYEHIIALQAEKTFQEEKEAILEQFPEEKRDEIGALIGDNPDQLEAVRTSLAVQGQSEPIRRHAPSGKVPLRNIGNNTETQNEDDFHDYVDRLYKRAKLSNDPIEKDEANRELSKLFNEYERAMFEGKDKKIKFTVTQCIQCGAVLTGDNAQGYASRKIACPFCGYKGGLVREPQHLDRW